MTGQFFKISGSNEQLQQQLEYTLLKPHCQSWWISKMQFRCEETLEERKAIKLCFKLGKIPQKRMKCFRLLLDHLAWIEHPFLSSIREFSKRFLGKMPALFKSGQCYFQQDNAPVHNSILVTDYLTKMCIKPPYSPDLAPSDFWLLPKLTSCRYKTIEEMKEAVTKVIDTLKQEDFHGAFQKLLER